MHPSTQFCDYCGASNRFDAKFCTFCGQPQTREHTQKVSTGLLSPSYVLQQRYQIVEKLGQGGFGAVYKVEDLQFSNANRAVKEMSTRGLNGKRLQNAIQAFKQEATLLATLTHQNLPRIYAHFEERGRGYLVMDYIEGETLEKRLEKAPGKKLQLDEVLHFGIQLSTVLSYLHTRTPAIIFRDLKPNNVMITSENHIYLIDFGIARLFKPEKNEDTSNLGTPGYAAPEQFGPMQTTISADIYSLGATLHQLASGRHPNTTPFSFPPLGLDITIPAIQTLELLIIKMVKLEIQRRPSTMQDIKRELQHISQLAQKVTTPDLQPRSQPPQRLGLQPQPPAKNTTLIVSQAGGGQFTTINAAIQQAGVNSRILVQPGTYKESLVLDKDIEIIGGGPRAHVILESSDADCILMKTKSAVVRGLTLQCRAGSKHKKFYAVDIPQGELVLEDCDITSDSLSCIAVHNETTNPTIRGCQIWGGKASGIVIAEKALGTIENCEISGHALAGITITSEANPTIRHCKIHDGLQGGLMIYDHGLGTIEDSEIFANTLAGIEIKDAGHMTVRRCQIYDGKQSGVYVHEQGRGLFENCTIYNNKLTGVAIKTNGNPLLRNCKIYNSVQNGISSSENGLGTFEDCEIFENAFANVAIKTNADPTIRRSKIHTGQMGGLYIYDHGLGTIENCEIFANILAGIEVKENGNPVIQSCQIYKGKQNGIYINENGQGTLEDCEIYDNAVSGVAIKTGADPLISQCKIRNGQQSGIMVYNNGQGTFEDCEVFANAHAGVTVTSNGNPLIRNCRIHSNLVSGIYVHDKGRGTIENCTLINNQQGAWNIGSDCTLIRNDNKEA